MNVPQGILFYPPKETEIKIDLEGIDLFNKELHITGPPITSINYYCAMKPELNIDDLLPYLKRAGKCITTLDDMSHSDYDYSDDGYEIRNGKKQTKKKGPGYHTGKCERIVKRIIKKINTLLDPLPKKEKNIFINEYAKIRFINKNDPDITDDDYMAMMEPLHKIHNKVKDHIRYKPESNSYYEAKESFEKCV